LRENKEIRNQLKLWTKTKNHNQNK
jgi:hypothetical protein